MVIDTCIFIDHLRAKDRSNTTLAKLPKDEPAYVSVVTLFELHCGANTPEKKLDIIAVTEDLNLLPFDADVAAKAGDIFRILKRQNKSIGPQDTMIAATCIVYSQPILTLNKEHFKRVDDLKILR